MLARPTLMSDAAGRRALAERVARVRAPSSRRDDEGDGDHPGEALRRTPSSGCSRRSTARSGRRSSRRCSPTCSRRSRPRELIERVIVVTGEGRAERIALAHARRTTHAARGAARPRRPRPLRGGDPGHHPRARARRRLRRRCCPATARCSIRRELDAALGADERRPGRGRPRPPRHRAPTRCCSAPPTRSAPRSARAAASATASAPTRAGHEVAVERARRRWRSTSTPPTIWRRLPPRSPSAPSARRRPPPSSRGWGIAGAPREPLGLEIIPLAGIPEIGRGRRALGELIAAPQRAPSWPQPTTTSSSSRRRSSPRPRAALRRLARSSRATRARDARRRARQGPAAGRAGRSPESRAGRARRARRADRRDRRRLDLRQRRDRRLQRARRRHGDPAAARPRRLGAADPRRARRGVRQPARRRDRRQLRPPVAARAGRRRDRLRRA